MLKARPILLLIASMVLLAASLYWRSLRTEPNPRAIAKTISSKIAKEVHALMEDATKIQKALADSLPWPKSRFTFRLYDSSELVQWNSDAPVPENLSPSDSITLLSHGGGYYLVSQFQVGAATKKLVGYIELERRYPVQNRSLANRLNPVIFPVDNLIIQPLGPGDEINYGGSALFFVELPSAGATIHYAAWLGWILFGLGAMLFVYASWRVALQERMKGNPFLGALVFFLCLLALRLMMVYGGFPGKMNNMDSFNPARFASSSFNDSIGNLFLNTVAFLLASLVMFSWTGKATIKQGRSASKVKVVMALICLLMAYGFHLLPFLYLETLFSNANITLDISRQLYFDSVRWLAYGCAILSHFTGFFYFFAFFRIAQTNTGRNAMTFSAAVCGAFVLMVIYHVATEREYEIPLIITSIHLAILFWAFSYRRLKISPYKSQIIAFLAMVLFCAQAALAFQMLSVKRDVRAMKRYANSFLVGRDVLAEYLLDQAAHAIEQDAFIQQQFTNLFGRLSSISHKVKRSHLSSYFDRYETQIYLYDGKGFPVGDEKIPHLDSLKNQNTLVSSSTSPFMVGIDTRANTQGSYTVIVPIRAAVPGYVVIKATLRELSPISVFPQLLLDDRFRHYAYQTNLSYAIYRNGNLQHTSGEFKYELNRFQQHMINPVLYRSSLSADGFIHIGMEDVDGRVVVVSARAYTPFNLLTNFCFLFLVGLLICSLGFSFREWLVRRNKNLPYSARIQLYVYLAFILPILIIGFTSLRLNSVSEQDKVAQENMQRASRLAQNLSETLIENVDDLQQELLLQSRGIGVDATVYSTAGVLLATSQPEIYSAHILSKVLRPDVLEELNRGNYLFTHNDAVDKLNFKTTYAAIRSVRDGSVLAILSIPFFESQQAGEAGQIRLASNIWVVVALVFILFYLVSFVALNWLTKPLRVIAATLRKTTLTDANRKLIWHSRDEIGLMVSEYNTMVDNLEVSKAELTRKQREAAWRELARQVAHEIKNPLTPIKLTLQQMEKSMQHDTEGQQKNIQSIKTLLHQVDILNGIASSFSAFAQMPELKLEKANINQLIQETVQLYSNSKPHTIEWRASKEPAWVMADSRLFIRIFGNIILNAFQSGVGNPVVVSISITQLKNQVRVAFSDNGSGMPPEIVDKVFIPYFSTKETGSGLGLAIARQGIEQAGGKIWCESLEGKGSIFLIELPILVD